MNQIKPGDTVVTIRDATTLWAGGHVVPKGTRGLVERSGPPIFGDHNVYAKFQGDPIGRQVRPRDVAVVHPEPATPGPIDPSKVKVGDPVAVMVDDETIGSYEVRGDVRGHLGGTWSVGPVNVASNGIWHEGITLTDHQPAPEPEPRNGSLALIENTAGPTIMHRINGRWVNQETGLTAQHLPANVHPLVVIDPAAVDVDALRKVWFERTGYRVGADGIRAILAHLGIEAP